jgi:hypothetical protein
MRRRGSAEPVTLGEALELTGQAHRGDGAAVYRARREAYLARLAEPLHSRSYSDPYGDAVLLYEDDPEVRELARRRHGEVMRNRARLMEGV